MSAPDRPRVRPATELAVDAAHWDAVAEAWPAGPPPLWRRQSDMVNAMLVERWLPAAGPGRVLKTDLFDELAGDGLCGLLAERAGHVTGIDISPRVVDAARRRHPALEAVVADVRELPFPGGRFDAVLSPSTLDHLRDRGEAAGALAELARVLAPGGRLVVTLDNPLNPLIAARNALPARIARRLRGVDYGAGWTCGPRGLRELLEGAGLAVRELTAVLHVPRAAVARMGTGRGAPAPLLRALRAGERLERLPTRYLTGHFVAALAERGHDPPETRRAR